MKPHTFYPPSCRVGSSQKAVQPGPWAGGVTGTICIFPTKGVALFPKQVPQNVSLTPLDFTELLRGDIAFPLCCPNPSNSIMLVLCSSPSN